MSTEYYDEEEVAGSYYRYHRLSCHIISNIHPNNLKRLRSWKNAVDIGLNPCGVCHPYWKAPVASTAPPQEADLAASLTATQISDMRRKVVRLVKAIDRAGSGSRAEPLGGQIRRLVDSNLIPRDIAALMRTITESRNVAEYESKSLSPAQSQAVIASWSAVLEWARAAGIEVGE